MRVKEPSKGPFPSSFLLLCFLSPGSFGSWSAGTKNGDTALQGPAQPMLTPPCSAEEGSGWGRRGGRAMQIPVCICVISPSPFRGSPLLHPNPPLPNSCPLAPTPLNRDTGPPSRCLDAPACVPLTHCGSSPVITTPPPHAQGWEVEAALKAW